MSPLRMNVPALITTFALMASTSFAEWTPPAAPDPKSILTEAQNDAEAGRFEDALAKHLWYHENALKFQRAQYGVRLSFALGAWQRLGEKYPPAAEKLKGIRDDAEGVLKSDKGEVHALFHDFRSINRQLGEEHRTTELFKWLDTQRPEAARKVYPLAQPALVLSKEYALAGKYLNPEADFEMLRHVFQTNRNLSQQPNFGESLKQHSDKSFSNGVSTLVALLVKNGRNEEAQGIAERARKEWEAPEFNVQLKKALEGDVPDPWP